MQAITFGHYWTAFTLSSFGLNKIYSEAIAELMSHLNLGGNLTSGPKPPWS